MELVLVAVLLQLAGGTIALLCARVPRAATFFGVTATVAACFLALVPTLRVLLGGQPEAVTLPWDAIHGRFQVEIDPLSAFFLVPVLLLSALAAVYGGSYLFPYRGRKSLGGAWFLFNVFVAGMVMVLIARTALVFLVAWEIMSVTAFGLVTFEHEKADVRRAGWIYLVATHLGVLFLLVVFLLLARQAGSLEFGSFRSMPAPGAMLAGLLFVLTVLGFGAKAGFVPFHVWLPEAHPAAPSHVSALMSGVMIKMGLYGICRMLTFLGTPLPWFGLLLAGLGLLTALVGIALAVHQRDLKRVLAYSSIENVGLIALGLGVGLWGWANHLKVVAVLGTTAALLHIWNHALIKGLLFFAAGSVVHGTETRDMEKLGGLMRRMPWTGCAMMVGAVAIAALPPLNGFCSKWLLYLSLLECGLPDTENAGLTALLAVGLLALVGGLAALAFVRLTGMVLLGSPRSADAEHAHESPAWMLLPMYLLVILCVALAVAPVLATGFMAGALKQLLGTEAGAMLPEVESSQAPLAVVGAIHAWALAAMLIGGGMVLALTGKRRRSIAATWGCGYARPTTRMQYTGRSFSEMLAEHLLPHFLRPRARRVWPEGLFPVAGSFSSTSPDPLLEQAYEPFFERWANRFARLRFLQQGKVHVYLVYIMFMVVLALAWASLRTWLWGAS